MKTGETDILNMDFKMVSMIRSIKIVFFLLYSNRLVIYTIVPKLCCSYYDASIGSATVFSCLHSC